jgi:hypothetical protein
MSTNRFHIPPAGLPAHGLRMRRRGALPLLAEPQLQDLLPGSGRDPAETGKIQEQPALPAGPDRNRQPLNRLLHPVTPHHPQPNPLPVLHEQKPFRNSQSRTRLPQVLIPHPLPITTPDHIVQRHTGVHTHSQNHERSLQLHHQLHHTQNRHLPLRTHQPLENINPHQVQVGRHQDSRGDGCAGHGSRFRTSGVRHSYQHAQKH